MYAEVDRRSQFKEVVNGVLTGDVGGAFRRTQHTTFFSMDIISYTILSLRLTFLSTVGYRNLECWCCELFSGELNVKLAVSRLRHSTIKAKSHILETTEGMISR